MRLLDSVHNELVVHTLRPLWLFVRTKLQPAVLVSKSVEGGHAVRVDPVDGRVVRAARGGEAAFELTPLLWSGDHPHLVRAKFSVDRSLPPPRPLLLLLGWLLVFLVRFRRGKGPRELWLGLVTVSIPRHAGREPRGVLEGDFASSKVDAMSLVTPVCGVVMNALAIVQRGEWTLTVATSKPRVEEAEGRVGRRRHGCCPDGCQFESCCVAAPVVVEGKKACPVFRWSRADQWCSCVLCVLCVLCVVCVVCVFVCVGVCWCVCSRVCFVEILCRVQGCIETLCFVGFEATVLTPSNPRSPCSG